LITTCLLLNIAMAMKLDCSYASGYFTQIATNGVHYCKARNVKITAPGQTVESFSEIYANENVNGLEIYMQIVNYFPSAIEESFENLWAIEITYSHLKLITKSDLAPFPDLKGLWLYGNDLETLEKDLFVRNEKLEFIDFVNNKLQHIDGNVIKVLIHLKVAHFSENPCIKIDATSKNEIQKLKADFQQTCQDPKAAKKHAEVVGIKYENSSGSLKIESKEERQIDAILASIHEISKRVAALEEQNHELIEKFGVKQTKGKWKKKKTQIDIQCNIKGGNKCDATELFIAKPDVIIKQVNDDIGMKLEANVIKEVSIDNQEAFFLPINLIKVFPQIEKLSIINSRLTAIDNVKLGGFETLKFLILRDNELSSIAASDFEGLNELTELDLSFNRIADIEKESFDEIPKLAKINLQGNAMKEFSFELLAKSQNLEEIDLSANELKIIKAISIETLKQLTSIDLSANKCINLQFPEDKTLNQMKKTIDDKCAPPLAMCCELGDDGDGLTCR